jgi:hypothetical protein
MYQGELSSKELSLNRSIHDLLKNQNYAENTKGGLEIVFKSFKTFGSRLMDAEDL